MKRVSHEQEQSEDGRISERSNDSAQLHTSHTSLRNIGGMGANNRLAT